MNIATRADELIKNISEAIERSVLDQLQDFVSRDLISIEYGPPQLMSLPNDTKLEFRQTVTLKLRDKEYIEEIEAENKKLKKIIQDLQAVLL